MLDVLNKEQFLLEMEDYVMKVALKKEHVIIWGDFNIHVEDSNDTIATEFLDLMNSMGFEQLINFPTHKSGGTLDLVFVRDTNIIYDTTVYNNCNDILLSDHFLIEMCLQCKISPTNERTAYLFRPISSINTDEFSEQLYKTLLSINASSLDDRVNKFFLATHDILNKHAPLQTRFSNTRTKSFYHVEIDDAKRCKRRAERRFNKTKQGCDKHAFNLAARNLVRVVKEKTNEYYSDRLYKARGDSKATYGVINHLLNRTKKKTLPNHLEVTELAGTFEDFFCSKIKRLCDSMKCTTGTKTTLRNCVNIPTFEKFDVVSGTDLQTVMDSVKFKYSTIDDIPVEVLKPAMNAASEFILNVVNESLQNGVFPKLLKNSHVIPIAKSKKQEDANSLANYRPISHISIISKILEKCVLFQLLQHLKNNNLLIMHQSAYRSYHSCETALLKVQNDILSTIDANTNVLAVLLDFSAAFDTISHEKLFQKLNEQYGISGTVMQWFKSYATDRTFQVKIEQYYSEGKSTDYGVQQGSVLGPIIFCLYTQEIESIIEKYGLQFHIFADDITIYSPIKEDHQQQLTLIKDCLDEIQNWAEDNSLKLNNNKTKFIEIKTRKSNLSLKKLEMLGNTFNCETYAKSLGVILDVNLSFQHQITDVCRKGFGMLRQLWRISSKINDVSLKIQLVHSCILSRMDYCNSLYFGMPGKKKLQRLLNAAIYGSYLV